MEKSSLNSGQEQWNIEEPKLNKQPQNVRVDTERRVAIPNELSGHLRELDDKVKSMMEKSQNRSSDKTKRANICKVCGKEGQWVAIRDHIEANHLEGVSLPCNFYGKEFRSRQMLRKHTCNRKWKDNDNMDPHWGFLRSNFVQYMYILGQEVSWGSTIVFVEHLFW